MTENLAGLRILVVEDEMLVCMDIEEMLSEFGCIVVGTAARVSDALDIVERSEIDAAILDLNLGREKSYPVAHTLAERGIPFLLSTGYDEVDAPYAERPRVQKPFSADALARVLSRVVAEAA